MTAASCTVLNFEVDDIDSTVVSLSERGVRFEQYEGLGQDDLGVFRTDGPFIAWFKDPSGNVLSVLQERTWSTTARSTAHPRTAPMRCSWQATTTEPDRDNGWCDHEERDVRRTRRVSAACRSPSLAGRDACQQSGSSIEPSLHLLAAMSRRATRWGGLPAVGGHVPRADRPSDD